MTTKRTIGNSDVAFHTELTIDKESGEFVFNLVRYLKPVQNLEMGLAQSASTLHSLAVLKLIQKEKYTLMDPLQSRFSIIYLVEIAQLGRDNHLYLEKAIIFLPKL
jgi:hypothetical protein